MKQRLLSSLVFTEFCQSRFEGLGLAGSLPKEERNHEMDAQLLVFVEYMEIPFKTNATFKVAWFGGSASSIGELISPC